MRLRLILFFISSVAFMKATPASNEFHFWRKAVCASVAFDDVKPKDQEQHLQNLFKNIYYLNDVKSWSELEKTGHLKLYSDQEAARILAQYFLMGKDEEFKRFSGQLQNLCRTSPKNYFKSSEFCLSLKNASSSLDKLKSIAQEQKSYLEKNEALLLRLRQHRSACVGMGFSHLSGWNCHAAMTHDVPHIGYSEDEFRQNLRDKNQNLMEPLNEDLGAAIETCAKQVKQQPLPPSERVPQQQRGDIRGKTAT